MQAELRGSGRGASPRRGGSRRRRRPGGGGGGGAAPPVRAPAGDGARCRGPGRAGPRASAPARRSPPGNVAGRALPTPGFPGRRWKTEQSRAVGGRSAIPVTQIGLAAAAAEDGEQPRAPRSPPSSLWRFPPPARRALRPRCRHCRDGARREACVTVAGFRLFCFSDCL